MKVLYQHVVAGLVFCYAIDKDKVIFVNPWSGKKQEIPVESLSTEAKESLIRFQIGEKKSKNEQLSLF